MARRKRAFLEDDLDSSEGSEEEDLDDQGVEDNDPDVRAERSLFQDPYQRNKRRRVGDLDDDEDEGFGAKTVKQEKKLHFTQAPSFVTGEKKPTDLDETFEHRDEEDERDEEEEEMNDVSDEEPPMPQPLPQPQRSFVRDGTGSAGSHSLGTSTPKLSQEEKLHFSKLQGSFGAKLMAKMGWQAGTGLGATGEGIVTPVETKLRPKASMGLAFKGFKEKTAQSKAEAKRRGEIVSEDESDSVSRRRDSKGKGAQKPKSDAWRRPRKPKLKVEHQTYEQIVQNAGEKAQTPGVGKIYDATSGEMREISSISEIVSTSWTPSTDAMRIPEVRHNLRLIVDVAKGDLDGLAREAKALQARRNWVRDEDARLRRTIQEEAELLSRLQNVHLIVDEIKAQCQPSGSDYEPSLEALSPHIEKLVTLFGAEYDTHKLDGIVVAAIAPLVRQSLASWQPLQDPTLLVNVLRRWRRALKMSVMEKAQLNADVYGARNFQSTTSVQDVAMTPYESLLWHSWLPRVRSCINNDWSPVDANPAVQLYEEWSNIIPPFIRDNILDQLVLPKIQKGIAEWQPRTGGPALQTIVFPWLPHVGLRMEELLGEAKRKVKSLLRNWTVSDGLPKDLIPWKDIFGDRDWNAMMLKYIVPKLGVVLRDDFKVNPRQQDMAPLELVFPWRSFLRSSVFSQLLETEFFPKWLDMLHIWLIQPSANLEEVAQWYDFWKSTFPQDVLDLPGIAQGFTRGLQLMNRAVELGPEAYSRLPQPDHSMPSGTMNASRTGTPKTRPITARVAEITFRSIVEEFAASHDLLFIPTGRAHEKSRMALFRVSSSVDGRSGVLVYILDDAVWASEGEDYRAISLEEMVLRAKKPRGG
ncbi:GC-rich sequence DNA-binding factor-like protein-domain-containing protein [Gautieria morchelliformis]|nr:GC-rich sequence DNA-binding factor-like protein-domain-containing protein [Gautieria morchelliformis]